MGREPLGAVGFGVRAEPPTVMLVHVASTTFSYVAALSIVYASQKWLSPCDRTCDPVKIMVPLGLVMVEPKGVAVENVPSVPVKYSVAESISPTEVVPVVVKVSDVTLMGDRLPSTQTMASST